MYKVCVYIYEFKSWLAFPRTYYVHQNCVALHCRGKQRKKRDPALLCPCLHRSQLKNIHSSFVERGKPLIASTMVHAYSDAIVTLSLFFLLNNYFLTCHMFCLFVCLFTVCCSIARPQRQWSAQPRDLILSPSSGSKTFEMADANAVPGRIDILTFLELH
jgi:hypothetical protein